MNSSQALAASVSQASLQGLPNYLARRDISRLSGLLMAIGVERAEGG
ncbi:MAG: hypothetical protein WA173_09135 [Pseudomonas sp.]